MTYGLGGTFSTIQAASCTPARTLTSRPRRGARCRAHSGSTRRANLLDGSGTADAARAPAAPTAPKAAGARIAGPSKLRRHAARALGWQSWARQKRGPLIPNDLDRLVDPIPVAAVAEHRDAQRPSGRRAPARLNSRFRRAPPARAGERPAHGAAPSPSGWIGG